MINDSVGFPPLNFSGAVHLIIFTGLASHI
jgi:hypothetical protein